MSEWKDLVGAIVKKKWDAGVIPTAEVFEAGMTETMELMKRAARVKTSDDVRGFFEYVEEQLGPIDSYDGKTRDKLQAAGGQILHMVCPDVLEVADEAAGAAKNVPGKGTPTGYADDLADGVADSKNFTVMGTPVANAAGAAAKKSSLAGSLAKNVGMSAVSFGVFAALGNLFGSDSSKVGAAQDTWTDDWTGTPEDATAAGLPGFGTAKKPKDEDGYSPLVSVIVFVAILALILAVAYYLMRRAGVGSPAPAPPPPPPLMAYSYAPVS